MSAPSVCIVDFCGYIHPGHFPFSCCADYYPDDKITRFGGEWYDVPDMPSTAEPTEEQCNEWAAKHGSQS